MRRLGWLLLGCFLIACTKESTSSAPSNTSPAPSPLDHVEEVSRTATIAEEPEEDDATPPEVHAKAHGCPAWTAIKACVDGDRAFGVGEVKGVRNPSLAMSTARNRAVAAVVGREGTLAGAVSVAEVRCGKRTYVLVRAPAESVDKGRLSACDKAALAGVD